jgi:hypothetical protein
LAKKHFSGIVEKKLAIYWSEGPEGKGPFNYQHRKDMAMRKWLAIAVALGAVLMLGSSSWSASSMEVKGVIADWKKLKTKIPAGAYLQVVKIEDELKGTTDQQGFMAFDSKFPKITVLTNGSFTVDLADIPMGKYLIALQRAVPPDMSGKEIATAIPILINKAGEPLIIEVPGTFPLDVGKVDFAVRVKKASPPAK